MTTEGSSFPPLERFFMSRGEHGVPRAGPRVQGPPHSPSDRVQGAVCLWGGHILGEGRGQGGARWGGGQARV